MKRAILIFGLLACGVLTAAFISNRADYVLERDGVFRGDDFYVRNNPYTGEVRQFYENGNLRSVSTYRDGKLDGKFKQYWENGKPVLTGKFLNGEKTGTWNYYNISGRLVKTDEYVKDLL
jgi:antitoxin component YwqK of YwqJK toxin-antitoxin module